MQVHPPAPVPVRVADGQSFRFHARAGTRIVVTEGCMAVCKPGFWSGEQLVGQHCIVRDGDQYLVRQRGWVTLQPKGRAASFCIAREAGGAATARLRLLEAWLASCLRRMRPRRRA
jgi:hypothetical protein